MALKDLGFIQAHMYDNYNSFKINKIFFRNSQKINYIKPSYRLRRGKRL